MKFGHPFLSRNIQCSGVDNIHASSSPFSKTYKRNCLEEPVFIIPLLSSALVSRSIRPPAALRLPPCWGFAPLLFTKFKSQTFFLYQSIKFWNSLPLEIKNSGNINTFKCTVETFLLNQHIWNYYVFMSKLLFSSELLNALFCLWSQYDKFTFSSSQK